MKSKILSVAFALCMLSVVFTALPGEAAVYYTGTVQTTDIDGDSKDVFFRGDWVYVDVELFYENVHVDADILITLETQTGGERDSITDVSTDTTSTGYYNSSEADPPRGLNTAGFPMGVGNIAIADVVLYLDYVYYTEEVARAQVMIRTSDMWLDPDPSWPYSPGQNVTITMVTSNTEEFYVQVLDEMGHDLILPWTGQTVDATGTWTETFTIPVDAEDGEYVVEVRLDDPSDALWFDEYFHVAKFELILESQRWAVLPGETVSISYMVVDLATLALCTDVDVEWTAIWYDMDGDEQTETGVAVPGYQGMLDFVIPAAINMTSDYTVHFWANDSDDRSIHDYYVFETGLLMADLWTNSNAYVGGEIVTITVEAVVGYDFEDSDALPDADVDIVVEKDGTVLTGYSVANLVTGVTGTVQHEFKLAADAEAGTYIVKADVSKAGFSVESMVVFVVQLEYGLMVELDKDAYYSGEVAHVAFTTIWGVDYIVGNSVFYRVSGSAGTILVGNSSTGSASFTVPADYVGVIGVYAITVVNDHGLVGEDSATVSKAFIAVAPALDVYSAGDTIQWDFRVITMMTMGLLSYIVVDDLGRTVASATLSSVDTAFPASGSITYTVPTDDASEYYTVTVSLKDGYGNNAQASSTVYLKAEYRVDVWLVRDSGFVSRAFEPGDTVEFGYAISTNGASHMSLYKIRFYATTDSSMNWYVMTALTTGTFKVTVPDNVPDGTYSLQAILYDGVSSAWLSSDGVSFGVLADQSLWQKEVGGMSVIDLTILLLIVLMIVLLIVLPFVKARMGRPKDIAPEPVRMEPEPPKQAGPPQ